VSENVLLLGDASSEPLAAALATDDRNVTTVADPAELLRLAPEHQVIIIDVVPPPRTAVSVCRELRAVPELADRPILVIASTDDVEERIRLLEAFAQQCDEFAEMDFSFLFDRGRDLFSIGYNVNERQSDPSFLATLLDRLPAVYDSPAMQMLARRALVSGGEAPRGDATLAARRRFEALGKMGAADELATMAAGAGASDLGIAMFAAQAELARGRRAEACARGRNVDAGATPPPFILRLRAYCAAVTGDRAAADLALEVARAQNAADAWYTSAVGAAAGAPAARPPAARYDNSLSTQLSIAAHLRPGPRALNDSSTLALLALARSDQGQRQVSEQERFTFVHSAPRRRNAHSSSAVSASKKQKNSTTSALARPTRRFMNICS